MTDEQEEIKVQRVTLIVPFNTRDYSMPSEWDWSELCDSVEPIIVVDASPPEKP